MTNARTVAPEELVGQVITVLCLNYYSYTGKLVEITSTCFKLENPTMTFNQTRRFNERSRLELDTQALPAQFWYIELTAIESFGLAA